MPEINVALIGHRFMGKAHSNAYRQVRRFFPGNLVPRMKVLCGKACTEELEETARRFGWEESDCEWERVIERKDIDIIDVSTPGHLHHAHAALEIVGQHPPHLFELIGIFRRQHRQSNARSQHPSRISFFHE